MGEGRGVSDRRARLYHKAPVMLVRLVRLQGIKVRENYSRVGWCAGHASTLLSGTPESTRASGIEEGQHLFGPCIAGCAAAECRGRSSVGQVQNLLARVARVLAQRCEDSHKLYAVHVPEVECIAKGKAHYSLVDI